MGRGSRGRRPAHLCGARDRVRALAPAGTGIPDWHRRPGGASFTASDIRSRFPRFTSEALAANQPIVDLVVEIAERHQVTPDQVALAWLLAKSPSIVPIPGSRLPERVAENIQAAQVRLTADQVAEIGARSAQLTVAGARGSGHETYR
jgi:aryl-alcohol dehydrogenase-like predicted oxidoreductase